MQADLSVDLSVPPSERWELSGAHRRGAIELFRAFNQDLGVDADTVHLVTAISHQVLPSSIVLELEALASSVGVSYSDVVLGNLHYDLLKVVLGCTSFAVDTPQGPLHGRNLDWWTPGRLLNDGTTVTHFYNGPQGDFLTVGWPGFAGAFSGLARGRFSVTLNAVLSEEPGQMALPVVFLLRQVLEEAEHFEEAVSKLCEATIATDCLLMVVGVLPGEMAVIERTPTRFAVRRANGGQLVVTNDYRSLDTDTGQISTELLGTSCGRFDRISSLVRTSPPGDLDSCVSHLMDDELKMKITVQHMAFHPSRGDYRLRVP